METLYLIALLALIFLTLAKGSLHIYLDYKNGHRIEFGKSRGYIYFLPYENEVSPEYENLKRICILLQPYWVWSVVVFSVIFFLREIRK